jgi:hypothetical protein
MLHNIAHANSGRVLRKQIDGSGQFSRCNACVWPTFDRANLLENISDGDGFLSALFDDKLFTDEAEEGLTDGW